MTSRERLLAATRGGETDRLAVLAWPLADDASDAVVGSLAEEKISLTEVLNPFGRARRAGLNLNEALYDDPEAGDALLSRFVEETRGALAEARDEGADGVLYVLEGAHPIHCSPMQYGGHYLERDRELLEAVSDAGLNVVFVVGDEGVYIDFVSDLPAHVFAWDSASSGVSVAEVRKMRSGALATNAEGADIALITGVPSVAQHLENRFAAV